MFAYCNNNPISRADSSGDFFNTVCGAIVGGLLAGFTRDKEKETFGEAFLRGAVTGAIAGAALDISIATAGAGAALAIAAVGGAAAAALDYGWETANKEEEVTLAGCVTNGIIGGGLNVLFMGAGRVVGRAIGDSVTTVAKALWKNTLNSVTSRTGKFVAKKLGNEIISNTISSTTQGTFGKLYSFVADKIGVY